MEVAGGPLLYLSQSSRDSASKVCRRACGTGKSGASYGMGSFPNVVYSHSIATRSLGMQRAFCRSTMRAAALNDTQPFLRFKSVSHIFLQEQRFRQAFVCQVFDGALPCTSREQHKAIESGHLSTMVALT